MSAPQTPQTPQRSDAAPFAPQRPPQGAHGGSLDLSRAVEAAVAALRVADEDTWAVPTTQSEVAEMREAMDVAIPAAAPHILQAVAKWLVTPIWRIAEAVGPDAVPEAVLREVEDRLRALADEIAGGDRG